MTLQAVDDLRADLAELRRLLESTTRPANTARLQAIVEQVSADLSRAEAETTEPAALADNDNTANKTEEPKPTVPKTTAQTQQAPPALPSGAEFIPIHTFAWDQSNKFVSVYVSEHMEGVKASGAAVDCQFGSDWFDLTVIGHNGSSYRLARRGLEKEINAAKSKFKVKDDRIVLLLRKVPGEYGPDHWTDLVPKRKRPKPNSDDPTAGIMDLMKDMYDNGDDQMRKTIGESLLKSQQERMGGL